MKGPLTDAEIQQLHAELDNAQPLTPWHWTIIGAGAALCLGALLIGARVGGLL